MTDEQRMPVTEHLEELRSRLLKMIYAILVGTVAAYFFRHPILNFLQAPIKKVLKDNPLRFFSLMEPFIVHIKVSVYAGIFFAIPVILYQIWMFVSPGLLAKEKKYLLPFIFMGSVFFLAGASLCYFIILPYGTRFFINFDPTLESTINIAGYINFCTRLILAFGIVFQLPLILLLLSKIGLVSSKTLSAYRKYAYIIFFVVGAILTPPDPMTQLLMATPLVCMYELSVFLTRIFGKKETPKDLKEELKDV
jgi:sec-independent protein translocase protein TatC